MINKLPEKNSFSLFNNYEFIRKIKNKINEIIDVVNSPAPSGDVLPEVTSEDNGDVLTVVDGAWDKASPSLSLHEYSTTEKAVGTWIDGKIVYEKTIVHEFDTYGTHIIVNIPANNVDLIVSVNIVYNKIKMVFILSNLLGIVVATNTNFILTVLPVLTLLQNFRFNRVHLKHGENMHILLFDIQNQ